MPRRRFRVVVPVLCLLSLIVCAGTTWLWWRSYRVHGRVGHLAANGRYTLHSLRGRLLISGPPPDGPDDETARKPAARMSNDELLVVPLAQPRSAGSWSYDVMVEHVTGQGLPCSEFAWRYGALPKNDPASAWPPLLGALEDPKKFAAAHEALRCVGALARNPSSPTGLLVTPGPPKAAEIRADEVTAYAGVLPIHYRTGDVSIPQRNYRIGPPNVAIIDTSAAAMAAVRDFWHDRLDVVLWSAPLLPFAALTAVPPLAWCVSRVRGVILRRRRKRRGLCLSCGYDLRGSQGKCSECGAPIAATVVADGASLAAVPQSV
jgi:hypothetical protein